MLALTSILYIFLGTTLAGSGMIVALTLGYDTLTPLLAGAAVGAVIALPLSWGLAKRLSQGMQA